MTPFETFWSLLNGRLSSYEVKTLGNIKDLPVTLLRPKTMKKGKKNILIVSGTHGNEIAGPWCLCRMLANDMFKDYDCNVSIVPIVNPDGFSNNQRYNQWNEISNQGFIRSQAMPSHEGIILLKNIDELKELGKDGFLSIHENDRMDNFYSYVLAKNRPDELIKKMSEIGGKEFGIQPDGTYEDEREGKYTVKDGCVYNKLDDTFEDYLFFLGTPVCIVTETPSKRGILLKKRVLVNCAIVDIIVKNLS